MSDLVISPVTRHLLDLFEGPLRDVRFPDADVERLARAVEEARTAHETVVRMEAAAAAAREALAESQKTIGKQTERTIAYARIYAADRPELLASIDTLMTPPRRGRGRPRKDPNAPPASRASRATTTSKDLVDEAPAASAAAE
ncbi:MAG TPA: hypothetical protein VM580_03925 [Labilithrix sp.]|nr:hypothetical protein [Labilithrix sp.]